MWEVFGEVDPLEGFVAVALVPLGAGGVKNVGDFDDSGADFEALADGQVGFGEIHVGDDVVARVGHGIGVAADQLEDAGAEEADLDAWIGFAVLGIHPSFAYPSIAYDALLGIELDGADESAFAFVGANAEGEDGSLVFWRVEHPITPRV